MLVGYNGRSIICFFLDVTIGGRLFLFLVELIRGEIYTLSERLRMMV